MAIQHSQPTWPADWTTCRIMVPVAAPAGGAARQKMGNGLVTELQYTTTYVLGRQRDAEDRAMAWGLAVRFIPQEDNGLQVSRQQAEPKRCFGLPSVPIRFCLKPVPVSPAVLAAGKPAKGNALGLTRDASSAGQASYAENRPGQTLQGGGQANKPPVVSSWCTDRDACVSPSLRGRRR